MPNLHEAHLRHAAHYCRVLAEVNSLYLTVGEATQPGLDLFDAEWSNIQAGHAWAVEHCEANPDAAQLCIKYPHTGAQALFLRQHPRERIHWLETMLVASRRLKHRSPEGAALGNLGVAYGSLGEYRRAIEVYEQSLAIAREIGDRIGEGAALGNLGDAYCGLGDYRRAIELHEQCLAITGEIGNRRGEGKALSGLGAAYGSLGEYRRAIEVYEQSLAIAREIGDRYGEGLALCNLSVSLSQIGRRAEAIAQMEAALKILVEIEAPQADMVRRQLAEWRNKN